MAIIHSRSAEVIALRDRTIATPPQRTHALLKADSLELVELVVPAGASMPEHAAPGEITLMGLEGRLRLVLRDREMRLEAGDLVHLAAGEPHAVLAETDCRALLTLCLHPPPPARGDAQPLACGDRAIPSRPSIEAPGPSSAVLQNP